MRLKIVTPLSIVVDEEIKSLKAEDLSGSFGVLPGHAEFLTSLAISVVSWSDASGSQRFCAVRGGVLTVTGGQAIAVATREAVTGDDLATLDQTVLARFRDEIEEERSEHVESTRLQLNAVRNLVSRLHPRHGHGMMS
ncbi:F-type H+-transporting ATPase subunit epsilon [Hoeflea marina]|uniref:ATP synthase epsilon chain n=1 Tax=Hoeflea marina TaxID=274592 RepID=A0A317PTT3_9HYPH|nr:F0F1 ATP synthase subunit epsilon [Hoeflea marina]PWW04539.1 F-type H+-transporting ATPase subunit epsilon [Hoeflea marina]